jgi:CHAD domain-containing protein
VGARKIHAALLDILVTNEPGLRANLDTEFLHDFRVAVRRNRSLLGHIGNIFPPELTEHFAAEFSWIGRLTGPPRDLDVLVLELRERRAELSQADVEALLAFLWQAQQQEHLGLVHALDSDRYRRLLTNWKAFLEQPAPIISLARDADRPLAAAVSKRAWRLSRRIAESAETIDEHSTPERLHEVRIDAKKLRYLVEVIPAFYDAADLECILGALKKLQRVLGDFNDATVQERRLVECGHRLAAAGGPAAVLIGLGRLAEQSRQRREHLRGAVVERLARFRARDTQSACRHAFKERAR